MEQLMEDQLLYDPLTPVTRGERRMLLAISGLGIAVAKVPLIPTKIAFLGIDFESKSQASFLQMYIALIVFFAVAFVIYGATDLFAWRRMNAIRGAELGRAKALRALALTDEQRDLIARRKFANFKAPSWDAAGNAVLIRGLFEFCVPIAVAAVAVWMLASLARTLT